MYFIYKKQEVAGNLSSSESPDKKQNSGNLPGGDTQGGLERVPLPQGGRHCVCTGRRQAAVAAE